MSHALLSFMCFMLSLSGLGIRKPRDKLYPSGAVLVVKSSELSFSEWIMYVKHL